MLDLIKDMIIGLNKKYLTQEDVDKLIPLLETLLQINEYSPNEFSAIQLLLSHLGDFEESTRELRILDNMIKELRLKIMRYGFNMMDIIFGNDAQKNIVTNIQVYSPLREGEHKKIEDFALLEDGTVQREVLYSLHPKLDIDSQFPIFNDYAQAAFNKYDGIE